GVDAWTRALTGGVELSHRDARFGFEHGRTLPVARDQPAALHLNHDSTDGGAAPSWLGRSRCDRERTTRGAATVDRPVAAEHREGRRHTIRVSPHRSAVARIPRDDRVLDGTLHQKD